MAKDNAGSIVLLCIVTAILIVNVKAAYRFLFPQPSGTPQNIATPQTIATPKTPVSKLSSLDAALLVKGTSVNTRMRGTGYTALMVAAQQGDVERAKTLLKAGADVNLRSSMDGTALTRAAFQGNATLVKLLIQAGAVVTSVDGSRGLTLAVVRGHTEAVKALLQAGADPNTRVDVWGKPDGASVLWRAVMRNRADIVQQLLKAGANPNVNDDNIHPILLSALMGESEGYATSVIQLGEIGPDRSQVVRLLIANGADPNGRSRHNGSNVLTAAVAKAPIDIVKRLIEKGAKVNTPGAYEQTPLMYAAERGSTEIMRLLLAHQANVNAVQRGVKGRTALIYAIEKGSLESVQLLLDHKANVNAVSSTTRQISTGLRYPKITPLDQALFMNRSDIAAVLKQHGGRPYAHLSPKEQA